MKKTVKAFAIGLAVLTMSFGSAAIFLAGNNTAEVRATGGAYVIDLDGGKTHGATNSTSSAELTSVAIFNTAFPQDSAVKVNYVSSSKMYSTTTKGPSTDAAKFGSSSVNGSVTYQLSNSNSEYVTGLIFDGYGWSGAAASITVSSGSETSIVGSISSYSSSYAVDLSSWNEPTQFTISFGARFTLFALTVQYDFKTEKDPVSAFAADVSSLNFDNPLTQTHQLTPTIDPATADQGVTWTSSSASVATVSASGLVTAVAIGNCTITGTTVGLNSSGVNLTVTIPVTVLNSSTSFTLDKNSCSWPSATTNTYSTVSADFISYQVRRFGIYNSTTFEINNVSGTTVPSIGNVSEYSHSIKSVVATIVTEDSVFAFNMYGGTSSYAETNAIQGTVSGTTTTFNLVNFNNKFFKLVNNTAKYATLSNIVINLKTSDEEILTQFISGNMHVDVAATDEGTGLCKTSGWYSSAKTAFNALTGDQRKLFANDAYFINAWSRVQKWAIANGETISVNGTDGAAVYGAADVQNRIMQSKDDSAATFLVTLLGAGALVLSAVFMNRRKKEN